MRIQSAEGMIEPKSYIELRQDVKNEFPPLCGPHRDTVEFSLFGTRLLE